jgi:hypothetical protein
MIRGDRAQTGGNAKGARVTTRHNLRSGGSYWQLILEVTFKATDFNT